MAVSEKVIAGMADAQVRDLLHQMIRIRRFEEKAAEMYARGRIHGFLHLYIGQEAVATGTISLLRDTDYIVSFYREHGHALVRGMDSGRVMAELFGRSTGVSGGRGGSMHLFDAKRRFLGGYANVGGQMPVACGLALAAQRQGTEDVTLCVFGDGAVNEGAFHESLNLAAVWKLPVLFLCENNFYGMGTAIKRVSALSEVYKRAEAYGIRAEQMNGMDVTEVRERTDAALKSIRRGEGPYFLEALTYRFRGHSMADPEFYRDKEEIEHWRTLDPIVAFSEQALRHEKLTETEIANIRNEVEEEMESAVRFAEESADPPLDTLFDKVYSKADYMGWSTEDETDA